MNGDYEDRAKRQKSNFELMVIACVSAGFIVSSRIVSRWFGVPDTAPYLRELDYHGCLWGGGVFAVAFLPWTLVLVVLRNIRRRRNESWIAEAEDLLWVAGMLWNILAVLGMVLRIIHFSTNGLTMYSVGLAAPMVLALPTAVHSCLRALRSGGNIWHCGAMAICFWLAAAFPLISFFTPKDAGITTEQAWYYAHAVSYLFAFAAAYLLNLVPVLETDVSKTPRSSERVRLALPQDSATATRCRIVVSMCVATFLYPFASETLNPTALYEIRYLAPWLYWVFLVGRLRKEQSLVHGDQYKDRVRSEWVWLMSILIAAFGAVLNFDLPYHPVQWLIPVFGMAAMCFGLCSYLLPRASYSLRKIAAPGALIATGMVLPGVSMGIASFLNTYLEWPSNPMLESLAIALGIFSAFLGLYRLRELSRYPIDDAEVESSSASVTAELPEEVLDEVIVRAPQNEHT